MIDYKYRTKTCQLFDSSSVLILLTRGLKHPYRQILLIGFCIFAAEGNASEDQFPYKPCFEQAAEKFNLDPSFIAAVASVESSFNPKAVSSSGAVGLMQIKWPQTAKELGVNSRSDLFDPCTNIDAGANYLANLIGRFKSKLFALAAYYQGPTKIGKEGNIPRPSVFYIEKVLREELLIAELSELIKAGSCDLAAFQAISQKVHHPRKRLKETSLWLKENHTFCSTPDLIRLSNRLPELMGTADAKGELKQQIHHAILEKSARKK